VDRTLACAALAVLSLEAEYRHVRMMELTPLPDENMYSSANRTFREQRFARFKT